jgi:hypothetical protein
VRRVIAITLVLVACSKPRVQPSSGGRVFGAGGGAAASTGTDTTDTTGTLKGGAGGGPGSGLAGATITGLDPAAGTQEWTPDVTTTTAVSTSTTTTTNPWHVPNMIDTTGTTATTGTH